MSLEDAAVDPLVVEVQVVVADADLPGTAPALVRRAVLALDPVGILARHDPVVEARLADIRAVLAGQEVEDLDVTAGVEERPDARLARLEGVLRPVEVILGVDRPGAEDVDRLEVQILLAAAAVEDAGVGVKRPDRC